MKPSNDVREVLLLSVLPDRCVARLDSLRSPGITVRAARRPGRALVLLRRRPGLVFVDLVHGPGLDPRVVSVLNREPRAARVVALHEGRLDAFHDQAEHLTVDGFCRLADHAEAPPPAHRGPPGRRGSRRKT